MNITEGRVDVLAKHCLKCLATIAKKGPRGKAEMLTGCGIPHIKLGKPLNAVFRLKERTYPK